MNDWTTPSPNAARRTARKPSIPDDAPARGGWFARHWRGELPLASAFWINTVLVGALVPHLFERLVQAKEAAGSTSLRAIAALTLVSVGVMVLVQVWAATGTLRAARAHRAGGGHPAWSLLAGLAAGCVLVSSCAGGAGFVASGEAAELLALASGHDALAPVEVRLSQDGRTLQLIGSLGTGSAQRVHDALKSAPGVREVRLMSGGGRVFEATLIAREIGNRRLDTYVEQVCASACTFLFLAGQERGATPNARIGFHRASFGDLDSSDLPGNRRMTETYRAAGISPAFLERVQATSSKSMWFPTRDELIANHVVTRVALGGESSGGLAEAGIASQADLRARLARLPVWAGAERRFPGTLDEAAAAGWAESRRGASDAQVAAASHRVLTRHVPAVLATAPDGTLDDFASLFIAEVDAALALGDDACGRYLDGELDGAAVFPRPLVQQDSATLEALFAAAPVAVAPASRDELAHTLRPVFDALSPEYLRVVQAPQDYAARPRLRCEAVRALYRGLLGLPADDRHAALRAMLGRA